MQLAAACCGRADVSIGGQSGSSHHHAALLWPEWEKRAPQSQTRGRQLDLLASADHKGTNQCAVTHCSAVSQALAVTGRWAGGLPRGAAHINLRSEAHEGRPF